MLGGLDDRPRVATATQLRDSRHKVDQLAVRTRPKGAPHREHRFRLLAGHDRVDGRLATSHRTEAGTVGIERDRGDQALSARFAAVRFGIWSLPRQAPRLRFHTKTGSVLLVGCADTCPATRRTRALTVRKLGQPDANVHKPFTST